MKIYRVALATLTFTALGGCAAGQADYADKPNSVQRASVLSKNPKGITIKHSAWGEKIAFRFADEHCATVQKSAVFMGSSKQPGSDITSTWRCE